MREDDATESGATESGTAGSARHRGGHPSGPGARPPWYQRHPGALCFVLLTVAYVLELLAEVRQITITSDFVWVQTVLGLHGRYGPTHILSSPDTFVLKYPLYLLANHWFGFTYGAVVFELFVCCVGFFLCVAASYALLVRTGTIPRTPWPVVFLVGVFTISVGDPTADFALPNERNLELGIAVLALVASALLASGRLGTRLHLWSRALWIVVLAVVIGLGCLDDPYNLYFVVASLAVMGIALAARARSWRQLLTMPVLTLAGIVVGSGVVYKVSAAIARHEGLDPYTTAQLGEHFLAGDSVAGAAQGLVTSLTDLYDGSFYGLPVTPGSARLLVNAACGLALVGGLFLLARRHRRESVWPLAVLPLAGSLVVASYVLGGYATTLGEQRYLIALVPLAVLAVPVVFERARPAGAGRVAVRLLVVVLALATLVNVAQTIRIARRPAPPHYTLAEQATDRVVRGLGLTKGYATYWKANINTYLSGGTQLTLPTRCVSGKLAIYYWLMDTGWRDKQVSRSFVVFDPNPKIARACTLHRVEIQFGTPARVVPVPGHREKVLVWNYDVGSRMPPRTDDLP